MKKMYIELLLIAMVSLLATPVLAKDGDIKICGTIQSINSGQVTLNNVSYQLSSSTEYRNENDQRISRQDFSVGELVELRIRDGRVDELEKEDEAGCGGGSGSDDGSGDDGSGDDSGGKSDRNEQEFCGQIEAISDSSITVGGQTYEITSSTEFESKGGTSISSSALSVGDWVKIELRNGILHEVDFESSSGCRSHKIWSKGSGDDRGDDHGGDRADDSFKRVRLRTKLSSPDDVRTSGRGWTRYESRAKKGKSRDRLSMKVSVVVSNDVPVLFTSTDGSAPQFFAYIQRGTETLAVCEFELDNVARGVAEYKVDLRERSGSFSAKKGYCDVDLSQSGVQNAIPSLTKGDDISVVPMNLETFLVGQL
ncbi:MAG: hypothetical protein KDD70_03345 [Bdellovibrionales bacterium]|nr:hypothetical protein [Bdellovibrionales bacterium]